MEIIYFRTKRKKNGTIIVRYQDYDLSYIKYRFYLGIRDLNTNQKTEVFLQLSYVNENRELIALHRTDVEKLLRGQVTKFKEFQLPQNKICDENITLKLEVYEFNKSKGNIHVGEVETTLQ